MATITVFSQYTPLLGVLYVPYHDSEWEVDYYITTLLQPLQPSKCTSFMCRSSRCMGLEGHWPIPVLQTAVWEPHNNNYNNLLEIFRPYLKKKTSSAF